MQYMMILIQYSFSFFRVTELESLGYIGRSVNKQNIHAMVERLAYSDWLILYYLAQVSQQIGIKKPWNFFLCSSYVLCYIRIIPDVTILFFIIHTTLLCKRRN